MKTPSWGALRHDVDELVARLVGKLDLIVKRTERGHDGIDYMVLVEDIDGQERTVWSYHLPFGGRGFERKAVNATGEQERIADEVWNVCQVAPVGA